MRPLRAGARHAAYGLAVLPLRLGGAAHRGTLPAPPLSARLVVVGEDGAEDARAHAQARALEDAVPEVPLDAVGPEDILPHLPQAGRAKE